MEVGYIAQCDAIDVAKYIINYAYEKNHPISNLQLQKILYFLWIDFYKEKNKYLFDDEIEAWKYGPIIPNVYNSYSHFSAMKLRIKYDDYQICNDDIVILNKYINKYYKLSATYLVDKSHKKTTSWYKSYEKGRKNNINFKSIIKCDC